MDTLVAVLMMVVAGLMVWLHALTLGEEQRSTATRALWWYYNRPWMLLATPRTRVATGLFIWSVLTVIAGTAVLRSVFK